MKKIAYIFLLIALTFCSEEKVKPKIDFSIQDDNYPVQESWNSNIYFTEAGTLKAVLYSDHLQVFDKTKEKKLKGVKIDFFDDNGKRTSQLTSKKGRVDDRTDDMFAIDSVVAINDSTGTRLETDELIWNNKKRRIISDKFVRITSPEEIIEGYGFESDQQLKNYVIYNITYQTTGKKK